MKKLLYIACSDIVSHVFDGVTKKIICQSNEFANHFDAYIIGYSKSDIALCNNGDTKIIKNNSNKHRRYKLIDEAVKQVTENNFSYVYIRYMHSDKAVIKLMKAIKNVGCKIIVEIPTYPYKSESKTNYKLRISYFFDCIYRCCLKKYVERIATFSNDKEIFSIPCINIMNGIDVDNVSMKKSVKSAAINLLAVASMGYWHGYDRLIEGMNDYYKNKGDKKIILHLVGNGDEISKYKRLVEKYSLQSNVIFHGFKSGNELDKLYDECDIAVASLGMHRANLFLASTLKSREYGAKGMPMVTSCEIDAFPSEICEYVLKCTEDESNIDVNQIISFYDDLIIKYGNSEKLAQKIRCDAKSRCDMSVVMKPIIDYFEGDKIE